MPRCATSVTEASTPSQSIRSPASADVGKGTIYNYFRTKEDIVVAFMADFEREVQARVATLDVTGRPLQETLAEFPSDAVPDEREPASLFSCASSSGQMFLRTEQFLPYMAEDSQVQGPQATERCSGRSRNAAFFARTSASAGLFLVFHEHPSSVSRRCGLSKVRRSWETAYTLGPRDFVVL